MTNEMRPPTSIKFGTDGWRAVIGEDYTFDNVRACAASVAMYLKKHGLAERGLIVGYDARFASEDFADAVAEVVAAQGIKVALTSVLCPTPVVSYSIIDRKAGGGVVITASHNPWRWNGFKYKPEYGGSASPEIVAQIGGAAAVAGGTRSAADGYRCGEGGGDGRDVRPARAVPGATGAADRSGPAEGGGAERRVRRDVRDGRGLLRRAAGRRQDEGDGAARVSQSGVPGDARAGADRAEPRRHGSADGEGRVRRRHRDGRRRRPRGHRGREGQLHRPVAGVRAAVVLPAGDARRTRARS